jgi:hypothetical protein
MTKIESEFNYLRDASVARMENGTPLRVGFPSPEGAFVPVGEWLIATRNFRLLGGNGQDWEDPGAYIKAGQRFRLRRAGSPAEAAVWEIA